MDQLFLRDGISIRVGLVLDLYDLNPLTQLSGIYLHE